MRYLNITFLFLFVFFTGCAVQQEQVVEVDITKLKKEDKKTEVKQEIKVIQIDENNKTIEVKQNIQEEIISEQVEKNKSFNIAVIYPSQVVGKYAIDGVNSITSYLLYKDAQFNLKTYDSMSEKKEDIEQIAQNVDFSTYEHIVLFMTKKGIERFLDLNGTDELSIYVPLINKSEVNFESKNVVFGGIDYLKQFEKLYSLVDPTNLSEFHDSISLGQILSYKLDTLYDINFKFQKRLVRNRINYESFLKTNRRIQNTSIFLNTPIVQTSILLSQMRAYEIEYEKLLSTQINYTPLILSLTQTHDRENMIIANSIGDIDQSLIEYGAILNTNFTYNWVNYSTLIGIDYLHASRFDEQRGFKNEILDNQVQFEVNLFETGKYSFKPYTAYNTRPKEVLEAN